MTLVRGFKTWCENTAIGLRREQGLAEIDALDPNALAAHLQVDVWSADQVPNVDGPTLDVLLREDPSSWSALTVHVGERCVIITNPAHSGGRPASDLMHELAHLILGHEAARVDVSEDGHLLHTFDRSQEDEANWLSGCLLLPRAALMHARDLGWSRSQIASQYGVSEAMVQYRLNVSAADTQLLRRRRWSERRN
ncbi:MAG: ImmA/IrrE family metallo-endopeptidase [Planctomycetes bacterium]|nr:ImmA/IrrE family metallo-endopeptidase [Planctomycetota bacterium]